MESPALAFLISRKALRQRWRSLPGQRWRRCPKTVFLAFVMLSEESISCRPSFHQQIAVHSRIPPKVWPRIERFLTLSKQSSSSSSSRCTFGRRSAPQTFLAHAPLVTQMDHPPRLPSTNQIQIGNGYGIRPVLRLTSRRYITVSRSRRWSFPPHGRVSGVVVHVPSHPCSKL